MKRLAVKAQSEPSMAMEASPLGLVALVRLLARDAAKEAFAQQTFKLPTATHTAASALATEQTYGEDQRP